jgi:predicted GNAT family acetyltransferase
MRTTGRAHQPHSDNAPLNETNSKQVADWYEKAQHSPNDAAVKESYDALANETVDQYNHLVSKGVKFESWKGEGQPYKDSAAMMADVRDNKHLYYFPTEAGYGAGEKISHPMLEQVTLPDGSKAPVNDLFRAVHDYYGHAKEGYEFGPRGEYNAFLAHSKMYSEAAKPAMAAETMGQNSWVNFGPHMRNAEGNVPKKGEAGYVPQTERKFAEQKALAMPPELLNASQSKAPARFEPATTAGKEAEKKHGLIFSLQDHGGVVMDLSLNTPEGDAVSSLSASQTGPKYAQVDSVITKDGYKKQGLAEALYRELGVHLQKKGIKVLGGLTVGDAPRAIRQRVFGPPIQETRLNSAPGMDFRRTHSAVRPEAKFEPASAAGADKDVAKAEKVAILQEVVWQKQGCRFRRRPEACLSRHHPRV